MDYLLEYMPAVGDIIRIGKYSYKLGEIISGFFAQRNDSESEFAVVWRRTDVFMRENKNTYIDNNGNITIALIVMVVLGTLIEGVVFYIFTGGDVSFGESATFMGVFLSIIAICYYVNKELLPSTERKKIGLSSQIEVSSSEYKLIRMSNGVMGICYWGNYDNCKLILEPVYDNIEKGFDNSYIVKSEEKYMLYNAELRMFVAEKYDFIIKYKEGLYLFVKGDDVSLMNSRGDRLY